MAQKLPPELEQHPMFRQGTTFGILSGDKPRYQGEMAARGHEGLKAELQRLGLHHEETRGDYDGPEKTVVVYNPTREQMFHLGQRFGQECVIWGHNLNGHQGPYSELLYTNGPHVGKAHLPAADKHVEHFREPPENYYTEVPGGKSGFVRMNYALDKLHPVPLSVGTRHPQALAPAANPRPDLTKNLHDAAMRKPRRPHPHAYPWHDGHTQHNLLHATPGAILKNDGGRTDQSMMMDQANMRGSFAKGAITDPSLGLQPAKGSFTKGDNIGGPNSAGDMSVPPPRGSFGHMADTRRFHDDGQLGKDEPNPSEGAKPFANEQAAGVGTPDYKHFAAPYGNVNPEEPQELKHYRLEGKLADVHRQAKDHGFTPYFAGGKHGKPDLANKNYNTGHLMIYDPSAGSGGDFNDSGYTEAWRTQHELAHALTYPEINKLYGEGRRIGKLGTHRSLNEARRAVHWEWLAGHRQRQLAEQMGVHISDADFAREMNTLMHDAAHRAVTGKFTEPGGEGFRPHQHLVPLETALGLVNEHGRRLGLQDPHATLGKSQSTAAEATEYAPMAKDVDLKFYTPGQAALILAKGLHERITTYAGVLETLQKREAGQLEKALAGGMGAGAVPSSATGPQALGRSEPLSKPSTSQAQNRAMHAAASGHSTLGIPKSVGEEFVHADEGKKVGHLPEHKKGELDKVAPPGREEQVRALKPKVGVASAFKIAWAQANQHGKPTHKSSAVSGGSENLSSNAGPGQALMMGEMPAGNMAMPNPPSSMQMSEPGKQAPHPENLRQKQAVPVRTDDPRSNKFVTAGNNQPPMGKGEPKDAQGKTDGRVNTLKPNGQPGLLPGDKKPKVITHGTGSGHIHPATLETAHRSPSNHLEESPPAKLDNHMRKDDVPMAKPPSGNPTAAGAKPPQSKPSMGGAAAPAPALGKGLGQAMVHGATVGAAQGMQSAHDRSAGSPQASIAGGVLGGLKGALHAAIGHRQRAVGAPAPAMKGELEKGFDVGSMKGAALQAAHQSAGAPGTAPAAPAAKMPTQAEHAQRAQSFQDFMPSPTAGHQAPGAAAPGPAAKPAAPAAAAKPMAPAAAPTSSLKPPSGPSTGAAKITPGSSPGIVGSQSAFGAKPKPLGGAGAGAGGGALGHLPKLSAVLNRPKAAPPALKQHEKDKR